MTGWDRRQTSSFVAPADGDHNDWVEIHNPANAPLNFSDYRLGRVRGGDTIEWSVLAGTTIAPGGYLLVWADDDTGQNGRYGPDGDPHASFKLGDNDTVELRAPNGASLGSVAIGTAVGDQSLGRLQDRPGAYVALAIATPRKPNPVN